MRQGAQSSTYIAPYVAPVKTTAAALIAAVPTYLPLPLAPSGPDTSSVATPDLIYGTASWFNRKLLSIPSRFHTDVDILGFPIENGNPGSCGVWNSDWSYVVAIQQNMVIWFFYSVGSQLNDTDDGSCLLDESLSLWQANSDNSKIERPID